MKNLSFLMLVLLLSGFSLNAQLAQLTSLQPVPFTFPPGSQVAYLTSDFAVCGTPQPESFKVAYDHCPQLGNVDCGGGCGRNPYRFTVRLYRNGAQISYQSFPTSTHLSNSLFHNVYGSPGDYRAHVKFERRKGFFCTGWETAWQGWTNTITAIDTPASPNFNVDGTSIPSSGAPINTCISNIRVNAAATSCETKYYLGVQECDRWWHRTNDYEWGKWFTGAAPDNINLQSLSSTHSYPPYYIGDPARQGSILLGGNLPSGQMRYYRVNVCTGEPEWDCITALIRVDGTCFDEGEIIEDINQYIPWNEDTAHSIMAEGNITIENDGLLLPELEDATELTIANTPVGKGNTLDFRIAPNPFSDFTTVTIAHDGEKPVAFELFNTLGERVRIIYSRETQFEVERKELVAGIYYFRASLDNTLLHSGKLIIE